MDIHFLGHLKEYLYSSEARMSPLEPEVPLVPVNATLEPPPEPQDGYARVFDGSSWSQIEDHRGEAVWRKTDAAPVVVGWLGEIGPDYTDQEPGEYPVWDAQAGGWASVPPEPEPRYILLPLEFQARFSTAEKRAVDAAAEVSDAIYEIKAAFRSAVEIDLQSSLTQEALAGLVAAEILTQERADEILAPVVE